MKHVETLTEEEKKFLFLMANAEQSERETAVALLIAFATDPIFTQKIMELHESGDKTGERALIDSLIKST